jgi:hypothetical protein
MTLTITLVVVAILLALTNSDSTAQAQKPKLFRYDTGIITPGPNQILRLTVVNTDRNDPVNVSLHLLPYIEQDNIYRSSAPITSGPVMLAPNEGVSKSSFNGGIWRVLVLSNSQNVRVIGHIINTATGDIQSFGGSSNEGTGS